MMAKADCRNIMIFLICLIKAVHISAQCDKPKVGDTRVLDNPQTSYSDGSDATVRCATGYRATSTPAFQTITCQGNTWTPITLQCQKKSCGALADLANGKYTFSPGGDDGVLFGAIATAKCNTGFYLLGQPTRQCKDGGWDGRDPICEAVKCSSPSAVANGNPDVPFAESYEYGEAVTFSCNKDFTLFGNPTVSCSEDRKFRPDSPRCIKVSCNEPNIANAQRTDGRAPYGYKSFVQYKCNAGFEMVGSNYLVCEEQGWNPSPPSCSRSPLTTTTARTTTRSTTPAKKDPPPPPTAKPPPHNNGWKIAVGVLVGLGAACVVCYVGYTCYKKNSARGYSGNVATKSEEGQL